MIPTVLAAVKRLSLLWRRFTPLEEFLLGVLQQELPEDARRINQRRIDLINRVSRPLKWTEIMFYHMRRGKVVLDEEEMFPCRSRQEIILAEVSFSPDGTRRLWKSRIYAVSGSMSSIVTRPSPKPFSFSRAYALRDVRLVDDPMVESSGTVLERLRKRLPPGYEELAGQSISGWRVFDPADVYSVPLEDADYVILAEREGGSAEFLGVKAEGKSEDVYLLSQGGRPKRLAATLKDALEKKP